MTARALLIALALATLLTAPAAAQQPQPRIEPAPGEGRWTAVVGALDKITARVTELELPKDREVAFGTLRITARACYQRPPEETPETYIFLEIDDIKADGTRTREFAGWMLASSPALNPLEHAVYDVWAISCRTSSAEGSSGSR